MRILQAINLRVYTLCEEKTIDLEILIKAWNCERQTMQRVSIKNVIQEKISGKDSVI